MLMTTIANTSNVMIRSNPAIRLLNNVHLEIVESRIYVCGNSFPIKDELKMYGAKWSPALKKWYFDNPTHDVSFLMDGYDKKKESPCCPFAKHITDTSCECDIICNVKRGQIEQEKRLEERRLASLAQKQADIDKYIVIYYLRDWGETDEYGRKFDTLELAIENYNSMIVHKNKRKGTPFELKGTLWGIQILHNGIIVKSSDSCYGDIGSISTVNLYMLI